MTNKQCTAKDTKSSQPKVPLSTSRATSRPKLCQFTFSDGRTCRMLRSKKHPRLCVIHARSEHELLAADQAARRLVSLSGDFKTASDINHVLGELFRLVAENRIPHRDAVSLAYIAQLLLQSLPHVRNEINHALGYRAWDATVQRALTPGASQTEEDSESEAASGNEPSADSEDDSDGDAPDNSENAN